MNSEIYTLESRSRTVGFAEGRPNLTTQSNITEACIRVLSEGQLGLVTSTNMPAEQRRALLNQASEMAAFSAVDPDRVFTAPPAKPPLPVACDTALFARSVDDVQTLLGGLESLILSTESRIKKVLKLQFHEVLQTKVIENSLGLQVSSTTSMAGISGEVLAGDGRHVEAGWDFLQSRFVRDLALNSWAQNLAMETAQSLGGKPIASGAYTVLVHPRVGVQILSLLAKAVSAEAVQMGRSFLKGRERQTVASAGVGIVDDPLLPNGVASDCVDDEGALPQCVDVVKNGVLVSFLTDSRSARRGAMANNGHGFKPGLSSNPSPQATNFFMQAGTAGLDTLMRAAPRVFFVKEVMGLHMADSVTGEFSLGAMGALIENGNISHPVRGVTLAGTLGDLLGRIDMIGRDIYWRGGFGAPYFTVSTLTVSGT